MEQWKRARHSTYPLSFVTAQEGKYPSTVPGEPDHLVSGFSRSRTPFVYHLVPPTRLANKPPYSCELSLELGKNGRAAMGSFHH